ncbi:hypothetical protein AB0442_37135 [Kitasatospora sp. NPDC085895]|uniref:hypothetical protein n=1 Tax=Kitasatospora sp. NPDC085895 TaxID=3155057 RepID=UPI003450F463
MADKYSSQAGNPAFPVWVLEHETEGVVGCTSTYGNEALPEFAFSDEERQSRRSSLPPRSPCRTRIASVG